MNFRPISILLINNCLSDASEEYPGPKSSTHNSQSEIAQLSESPDDVITRLPGALGHFTFETTWIQLTLC